MRFMWQATEVDVNILLLFKQTMGGLDFPVFRYTAAVDFV